MTKKAELSKAQGPEENGSSKPTKGNEIKTILSK